MPSATAILDRFLHHAEIITITGKSYRLRNQQTPAGDRRRTFKTSHHRVGDKKEGRQGPNQRGNGLPIVTIGPMMTILHPAGVQRPPRWPALKHNDTMTAPDRLSSRPSSPHLSGKESVQHSKRNSHAKHASAFLRTLGLHSPFVARS